MALVTHTQADLRRVKAHSTQILDLCAQRGATAAEVSAVLARGFDVSVRNEAVESLEYQNDQSVSLTVFIGQQSGHVATSDLSEDSLSRSIDKALTIAQHLQPDPFAGLPEQDQLAFDYPDLDLYHPWGITPEAAIDLGCQCEQKAKAVDTRIKQCEAVNVGTQVGLRVYANSLGFVGAVQSSMHSLSCCLIAGGGQAMHRDYEYSMARNAQKLASVDEIARRSAQRTLQRLHARRIKTQNCAVIFEPRVAKSLLGSFIAAISGRQVYRKASFLYDALDTAVFAPKTVIKENPFLPGAVGSVPFDSEGVRPQAREIVRDGVLMDWVLNTYTARKLGLSTTGNAGGVHNLSISRGKALGFEALLKEMDRGLLVTELMGQGVNLVTGDYSRGAFGFWVEKGEIQFPVEEITIAANLKTLFKQLLAVGDDVDRRGNIQTGSLLFKQMTVAGM